MCSDFRLSFFGGALLVAAKNLVHSRILFFRPGDLAFGDLKRLLFGRTNDWPRVEVRDERNGTAELTISNMSWVCTGSSHS